jgi:hypoxanthine phosphoribosyltransferase
MEKDIQILDKEFTILLGENQIQHAVDRIASELSFLKDENPIFLSILNGSFMFASDLMKRFQFPCNVSFVKFASYQGFKSTGIVNELIGLVEDVKDRTVVILEDIVETGNTLMKIDYMLKSLGAKKVIVVCMFVKRDIYKGEIPIDYAGIDIPNEFVVGYGSDYDGMGRNLNELYILK